MRIAALPIVAAALLIGTPVLAQEASAPAAAPVLKAGQMVRTADGQTIGRVDDVQTNAGQPVSVSIIYDQRFIHVPSSTLSAGSKGLVTSLSRKDVSLLN